ncbi:hypothetical protein U875_05320 [Pandoraea pnomenusa 3kgm]|nr:hypothetical protein U875_05320 [Pandoraea pnomenusa 3kgm]AHB74741.2 hypothetical protein X636_04280 [Pandoraea pnomenusa]AHN77613.1 hypothetical protein DA70_22390 [Pandoraea pnomenusa]
MIAADFGSDIKALGVVGSLFILGYALGSFLFGMMADRLGRRLSLGLSIAGYGVVTAVTGFSQNIFHLGIGRFLAGFGGGGELTVGVPYVIEVWEKGKRTWGISLMFSGYAVGLILTALVAKLLLPLYGWRALYFFSIVPAILIFFLRIKLDESPRYVEVKEGIQSGKIKNIGFFQCLSNKKIVSRMIFGTFVYISITSIYYAQAFYEVTMMREKFHLPMTDATDVILLFNAAMFICSILAGYLGDRIGRRLLGALSLIILAVAVWVAYSAQSLALYVGMGMLTFGMIGASWSVGMAHVGELFPTQIRGSAYGWCVALGRVPSIFAPLIIAYMSTVVPGGVATAMQWSFVILVFALIAYLFGPETHGEEIDDLVNDTDRMDCNPLPRT